VPGSVCAWIAACTASVVACCCVPGAAPRGDRRKPPFPELGRTFYDNGPKALIGTFAAWLTEQTDAGRLAVHDPAMAGEQFVAMLHTSRFLRASLGLARASEAGIDAAVAAAATTFLKAYTPR
jgi:hypothetical protein